MPLLAESSFNPIREKTYQAMPTATASEYIGRFIELYELAKLHRPATPSKLTSLQDHAAAHLEEMRFPTRRDEDWKYTSVRPIVAENWKLGQSAPLRSQEIEKAAIQNLDDIRFVFVNGQFVPALSTAESQWPQGLTIKSLAEALEGDDSAWLSAKLQAHAGHDNPFVVMNTAFGQNGWYMEVQKGASIEKPVHLMMFSSGDQAFVQFPQLWVHAQKDSDFSVIEHYLPKEGNTPHFTCAVSCLRLEANARVHHYRLQRESTLAYQINYCEVEQARDSVYNSYAVDLGGAIVRNNQNVLLEQPNTETHLNGIYLINGQQHVDNQTFMDHAVPHCNSNELYKGIVSGKARGVFNGKVLVRPDAQKTNAFQQNSTLLLSPDAVMDAKPQLEIFADDVKCSHGATIGQLDESAVFYLRSRGLPLHQARTLLQFAFLGEVTNNMPHEAIRSFVEKLVHDKLYNHS